MGSLKQEYQKAYTLFHFHDERSKIAFSQILPIFNLGLLHMLLSVDYKPFSTMLETQQYSYQYQMYSNLLNEKGGEQNFKKHRMSIPVSEFGSSDKLMKKRKKLLAYR